MSTSFAPLRIRQVLMSRYADVSRPVPFGPDGWYFTAGQPKRSFIISCADFEDGEWVHASVASPDEMPTYDDLCALHAAVFGDGYAYQCFVPASQHVNIHEYALHLWGRLDGRSVTPEFGMAGSI